MRPRLFTLSTLGMLAVGLQLVGCGNNSGSTGGGTGGAASGQGGSGPASGSGGAANSAGGAAGQQAGTGGQVGTGGHVGTGGAVDAGGTAGRGSGGSSGVDSGVMPGQDGGSMPSSCTGNPWPTGGNPMVAGPFQVTVEKNVGPLAGAIPDPVYGNTQQRFNVYRPAGSDPRADTAIPSSCGATVIPTIPSPIPPSCLADEFLRVIQKTYHHSAGVAGIRGGRVAEHDRLPAQTRPPGYLPQLVGMNWIIQQNDDPTSPYYHHLDTAHIGAAGPLGRWIATSTIGSDPHIQAIATMAGATAMPILHEPALFLCGGQDTVVPCSNIQTGVQLPSPRRRSCWRGIRLPQPRQLDRFNQGIRTRSRSRPGCAFT